VSGPIQSLEQLAGKRIATSFEVLAGELFQGVDAQAAGETKTKVEYVGGSVEAACALGMADGIGESSPAILCWKSVLTSVTSRSCR
jgi:ATP phosphoribosyltransferase